MNTNAIVSLMGRKVPAALYATNSDRLPRAELGERSAVERVDILELNPSGEPMSSDANYSRRQAARKRTVRVKVTQALHVNRNGAELWVEPRFILASWDEYQAARTAHVEYRERGKRLTEERNAKRAADAAELTEVLASVGFDPAAAYGDINRVQVRESDPRFNSHTAVVTLSLRQVKTLIERARAQALSEPLTKTEAQDLATQALTRLRGK